MLIQQVGLGTVYLVNEINSMKFNISMKLSQSKITPSMVHSIIDNQQQVG